MIKKYSKYLYTALIGICLLLSFTSCSEEDPETTKAPVSPAVVVTLSPATPTPTITPTPTATPTPTPSPTSTPTPTLSPTPRPFSIEVENIVKKAENKSSVKLTNIQVLTSREEADDYLYDMVKSGYTGFSMMFENEKCMLSPEEYQELYPALLSVSFSNATRYNNGIYLYINVETDEEFTLSNACITGDASRLDDEEIKTFRILSAVISQIISDDMTDAEKVVTIHDYIILNTAYDEEGYQQQINGKGVLPASSTTTAGLLDTHKSVCEGYAKAFKLFMDMLQIDCRIVYGYAHQTSANNAHVWNVVKIDGNWYHVDVTFDDPVPDKAGLISYDYLFLDDRYMGLDHIWSEAPVCSSESLMFFAERDYIADNIEEAQNIFLGQFLMGRENCIIIYPAEITEDEIFDMIFSCTELTTLNYYPVIRRADKNKLEFIFEASGE